MNEQNNTTNHFKKLIECLEQEIDLYCEMAETIQKKQDAIISNRIEDLRKHVTNEKSFIEKSMEMAEKRKKFQNRISSRYNLEDSEPKLKIIIDIAPPENAIKLSNLRYRLKEILNEITRINNENKLLLDFSIEHVKGMAQLFLNINEEDHEVYGVDGVLRVKQADNKMLDCQI